MEKLALDGLWLVGSWGAVYLAGVVTSQWFKDKLMGVPAELRASMKAVEASAKARLSDARAKVLADVMTTFKTNASAAIPVPIKPAPVPPAPLAPVARVAVAPAPLTVAAAPVAPVK